MRTTTLMNLRRRGAFTLVELLVASALTILIMTILASAFQTGLDSISYLRTAGELQDRLRSSSEVMRLDLMSPHFDDPAVINGRLSNVTLDRNAFTTPQAGFFRIEKSNVIPSQGENPATALRAQDYSSRSVNDRLVFTSRLSGKTRQAVYTAPRVPCSVPANAQLDNSLDNLLQNPANTYASRWAIVSWFLVPTGEVTGGPNPGSRQPLYNLHRRVWVLAEIPGCNADPNPYYAMTGTYVNTARDVAPAGALRPSALPAPNFYAPLGDGSDVVMSNVLSFEVKADYTPVTVGGVLYPRVAANVAGGNNQDYPFDDLPPNPVNASATNRVFDTGLPGGTGIVSGSVLQQQTRIRAVQVKLRIYDPKNKTARQMTFVQEL